MWRKENREMEKQDEKKTKEKKNNKQTKNKTWDDRSQSEEVRQKRVNRMFGYFGKRKGGRKRIKEEDH